MLLETDYSSEAFKENINILLLLTGSFPPKPLKTTAHGLPKISRNLSSNGPTFGKKYKKGFLFSNIGIKQGKMGTETSKIALNAHVHRRTANQPMSRPERHVDDITDMRRSCRLRENTSGRRPLGSSSRLLKVPIVLNSERNITEIPMQHAKIHRAWLLSVIYLLQLFSLLLQHYHSSERF